MKRIFKSAVMTLALVAAAIFNLHLSTAFAQGTAFTYQGRLNSGGGLAGGNYDLTFAVYDTNAPAGNLIAGPVTNAAVTVSNGLFTVILDFGTGVFTGPSRWLEMAVRTNGPGPFFTLVPRQNITATPYAIMANSASNLLGTVSAAQLAGPIPAGQITGVIPSADISGTYGNAVSFNNGADMFDGTFVGQFFGSSFTGGIFTGAFLGNGSGLFGLTAGQMPTNVAFLNSNQVFTAQNFFTQGISIGNPNPSPVFQIETLAGQSNFRLQTTNNGNGAVIELRNTTTNQYYEYLGAINFNDFANDYHGQIGYISYPSLPNYDYLAIRINGLDGSFKLTGDATGQGANGLINGACNIAFLGYSGNVIAGGGSFSYPNAIFYGSDDFIGAGLGNQISSYNSYASYSFIGGGFTNLILADASVIVGGNQNVIQSNAPYSFIGGGNLNAIEGLDFHGVIGGGAFNTIQTNAHDGVIAGGFGNTIQPLAFNGVIGGGYTNTIQAGAQFSTIGGGVSNSVAGYGGTVPGGFGNSANGLNSFAAGTFAQATNDGAFVLTDDQPTNFFSTASNQLSARFGGGVRFVTGGAGMTLDGQPVVSGTFGGKVVLTNSGNSFSGNGTGLTNVNAAFLNGLPSSAFAPASGSPNYIQNQNLGFQAASFQISGSANVSGAVSGGIVIATNAIIGNTITTSNAQVTGLIRSGSETANPDPPSPAGLVIRRVNSTTSGLTSNTVVALSGTLSLVRDGTPGGFLVRYPALPGNVTVACMGIDSSGVQRDFYTALANPGTAGFVQIYPNSLNVVHFECTFGVTYTAGQHLTQVTLSRYGTDYFWSGNIVSTYNQ